MIRNYPLSLSVNDETGEYTLKAGGLDLATVQADEPLTAMDALREIFNPAVGPAFVERLG